MSKRDHGKKAVESMLAHGMHISTINEILQHLPACAFTNGAYERLLGEQIARKEAGQ